MNWQSRTRSVLLLAVALSVSGATTPGHSRTPTVASSATASAPVHPISSASDPSPSHLRWSAKRSLSSPPSKSRTEAGPHPSSCDSWRWSDLPVGTRVLLVPLQTRKPSWASHDEMRLNPDPDCRREIGSTRPTQLPAMALSPEQCLQRLRVLYRDAMKVSPINDQAVLLWADNPEVWAAHQISHRGWSYHAAEAVVRQCRVLRKRAALATNLNPELEGA